MRPNKASCRAEHTEAQRLLYFQFRDLPSAIHSIAESTRRCRVSAPFASAIHSAYSRLWLGGKVLKAAAAFLFFASARVRSLGTTNGLFGFAAFRTFTPCSFSLAAALIQPTIVLSGGRSDSLVMSRKGPPARFPRPPMTSAAFQRMKLQCCLNAAIPQRTPS